MSDGLEQIFVSDDLLRLMRYAAGIAVEMREPFVTIRVLLLALLDEPTLGAALSEVLPRGELLAYAPTAEALARMTASRIPEPNLADGERPSILRFNTLAFKTPDNARSVWLSREAFVVWHEGARRVEEGTRYLPRHLAYGIAADAVRNPGILTELHISPGVVNEAILSLK